MKHIDITSKTPCCGRSVKLMSVCSVPNQKYDRKCHGCGFRWTITRKTLSRTADVNVDRLDWQAAR